MNFTFLYVKMTNKYYQKYKERLKKKTWERYQSFSEKEKIERQKKPQKYIKFLLKKKKKIIVCIKNLSEQ